METCCDLEEQGNQHEQDPPDDRSQTQFFQTPVPSEPVYFVIDEDEWTKLKTERTQICFKGLDWTNVIAEGIHSLFPYCSVGFKRHRLRRPMSRKNTPEFWCDAYCRFKGCPVTVKVSVTSDLKAKVTFRGGSTKHIRDHIKRRPIRASYRKKLGEELQKTLPKALYLQRLKGVSSDVIDSGCRDDIPSTQVLKNILCEHRRSSRLDSEDEITSVQMMLDKKKGTPDEVLQNVMMHPKGLFLWSKRGIEIYYSRCQEDVVYIDSACCCLKKNKDLPPFYVYELVVRNPQKLKPPLSVATLVTCRNTIPTFGYFLRTFLEHVEKKYGRNMQPPLMLLCDISEELMETITLSFTGSDLHDTMNHYYKVATGKGTKNDFKLPILHRCLRHFLKDAEEMCRKYAPAHYHLAMHVCALLTTVSSVEQLDEMVQSAAVVFSSPCTGPNVEKHLHKLQSLMLKNGLPQYDDRKANIPIKSFEKISWKNEFGLRYRSIVREAPLQLRGNKNQYFCKGLMDHMTKHHLPFAGLWTQIMLGDLGRHGTGELYEEASKEYASLRTLTRQNITDNNATQVNQWDVQHVGFQTGRLTRMDDLIVQYQCCHTASLREYEDSAADQSLPSSVNCDKDRTPWRGVYRLPFSSLNFPDSDSSDQ